MIVIFYADPSSPESLREGCGLSPRRAWKVINISRVAQIFSIFRDLTRIYYNANIVGARRTRMYSASYFGSSFMEELSYLSLYYLHELLLSYK